MIVYLLLLLLLQGRTGNADKAVYLLLLSTWEPLMEFTRSYNDIVSRWYDPLTPNDHEVIKWFFLLIVMSFSIYVAEKIFREPGGAWKCTQVFFGKKAEKRHEIEIMIVSFIGMIGFSKFGKGQNRKVLYSVTRYK